MVYLRKYVNDNGGFIVNKKIRKWIDVIGKKNMIAISALVLVLVVVGVGFAIKNNNKNNNEENAVEEESVGLQVEENADDIEGDSIDFSEFESEEDKTDNKKEEGSKNNSSLVEKENADDEEGDSVDFNEIVKGEDKKEEPKLDVELDKDSKTGYTMNKDDNAFADLDKKVQDIIKEVKNGKMSSLPKAVQTKLGDKTVVCDVFDLEPEKGQKKDKDGYYTVELTVDDLSEKYTKVVVLHYSEARELWEVIEPTKVDGDKITVKFADLSPVIICGELIETDGDESGNEGNGNGNEGSGNTDTGAEFGPLF